MSCEQNCIAFTMLIHCEVILPHLDSLCIRDYLTITKVLREIIYKLLSVRKGVSEIGEGII